MKSFIKSSGLANGTILNCSYSDSDTICSSFINFENPRYIEIDGSYYASLLVINYSREMEKAFLERLASLDIDTQISIYYEKLDSYSVIKELTYNIGNAGASIKTTSENQRDIDVVGGKYGDAKQIRKALQLGEENLFFLSIYIGVYADNVQQLSKNLNRIESIAVSSGLTTIRASYRQEEAIKAELPFLQTEADIERIIQRNVLTSGLVSTYPFLSNEMFDEDGVIVGTNSFDNSVIMLDRFDTSQYKNANMFIIGTSGSGKSYFSKLMVSRNRFLNIRQFIIDPDREYEKLAQNLAGEVIKFGTKGAVNVFDIREAILDEGESYLRNKLQKLKTFFSMVFEGISKEDLAILEEQIILCYNEKSITEDNESLVELDARSKVLAQKRFKSADQMPKIEDLYKRIQKHAKLKKYTKVLKPFVTGSLNYFNKYTDIKVDNKLIVVDVHDIEESIMPIAMFVITDMFWDEIKKNRNEKKILYLDEIWKLINKNEGTADFVFKLFKTIRKYGGGATAITQDISDFFMLEDGKYGKSILNNSSIKCMFQLEETDINLLKDVIQLSDEEKYRLINLKRGSTIIHAGRNSLMADVISSDNEHQYINTDIT